MIPNLGIAELELKGNKAVLNLFRPSLPLLLLMNIDLLNPTNFFGSGGARASTLHA